MGWVIEDATLVLVPLPLPPPQVQVQSSAEELEVVVGAGAVVLLLAEDQVMEALVEPVVLQAGVVEAPAAVEVVWAEVVAGVVEIPAADDEDEDIFGVLVARVVDFFGQVKTT